MLYLQGYNRMTRFVLTVAVWLIAIVAFAQAEADGQLYTVLISGGRNRLTNHERYWNDCALLYRTLRGRCHVPRGNISVLISDGSNPAEDMIKADGSGFASSPVDLDGDGEPDVSGAATLQMAIKTFRDIAQHAEHHDKLLVFLVGHGNLDDVTGEASLSLWGNDQLNAQMLSLLLDMVKVSRTCVIMGQCNAGGFMDALRADGLVVSATCSRSEQSWSCPDRPYDEFVYHWICAVNGSDESGQEVDADSDRDGWVSLREAFDYARSRDRRVETPEYYSLPEELGRQWLLSHTGGTLIASIIKSTEAGGACYTIGGSRQSVTALRGIYIEQGRKRVAGSRK